jgi:hypothetical protein
MKHERHGMRNTKTYRSWSEMRQRCNNPNSDKYKYYMERGIRVCDEWNGSFVKFFNDMGERPENHTLDRINVDKGYFKENCRWASTKEQARNKRDNRVIEYNGNKRCMSEWAEIYGIKVGTLWRRLNKGMQPPECFLPVGKVPRGINSHGNRRGNL